MVEILGNNLLNFFETIEVLNEGVITRSYKGKDYEVWSVYDSMFDRMSKISDEHFEILAGEDAWWRWSSGSSLGAPYETNIVNGHKLISWSKAYFNCEATRRSIRYESLSSYLCDCVGASQPRNVCALAVTLAKYNKELFSKYEGE